MTPASEHETRLRESYRAVAARTWTSSDFQQEPLDTSRALFTPESLAARSPRPKPLEVYALLSGIPFDADIADPLVAIQKRISEVIGDVMHYWVAAANLGVEYCVFKWPTDPWQAEWLPIVERELSALRYPSFRFEIGGIQVNPDGCVVARGFDEKGGMFAIRERMKATIPFLPARQSGWAHIPMGRILEPLGARRFAALRDLMRELEDARVATTTLDVMRFVHETRWYMEERTLLKEYRLTR